MKTGKFVGLGGWNVMRFVAIIMVTCAAAGCVGLYALGPATMVPEGERPPEWIKDFAPVDRTGDIYMGEKIGGIQMRRLVFAPASWWSDSQLERNEVISAVSEVTKDFQGPNYIAVIIRKEDSHDKMKYLVEKRQKSSFHRPVQAKIGQRECWIIHDRIHDRNDGKTGNKLSCCSTLEIYFSQPSGLNSRPDAVWVIGASPGKQNPVELWDFVPGPHPLMGHFYEITKLDRDKVEDGHLISINIQPWTPKIDGILQGNTNSETLWESSKVAENAVALETLLNNTLIEWKSKGLPEYLQQTSAAKLKDMAIQLEKAWAKLDFEVKRLKDAADEDARQVTPPGQAAPKKKAPAGATSIATLIDQRKTILGVILGAVKQTAAQRAMEG